MPSVWTGTTKSPKAPTGLRGIILRDNYDELVVQASPDEIQCFGAGGDVELRRPSMAIDPTVAAAIMSGFTMEMIQPGTVLYTPHAIPVGTVQSVAYQNLWHDSIDVTTFSDPHHRYIAGRAHARLRLELLVDL